MPDSLTEEIKTRVPSDVKRDLKTIAKARGLGRRGLSVVSRDAFDRYLQQHQKLLHKLQRGIKLNGHRKVNGHSRRLPRRRQRS